MLNGVETEYDDVGGWELVCAGREVSESSVSDESDLSIPLSESAVGGRMTFPLPRGTTDTFLSRVAVVVVVEEGGSLY